MNRTTRCQTTVISITCDAFNIQTNPPQGEIVLKFLDGHTLTKIGTEAFLLQQRFLHGLLTEAEYKSKTELLNEPNPPDYLVQKGLFLFPGWETTMLGNIPPELHPSICSYAPPELPVFKTSYKLKNTLHLKDPYSLSPCAPPSGLTIDQNGLIFASIYAKGHVEIFNRDGTWVQTLGFRGDEDGQFDKPEGLAVDILNTGNLVVLDSGSRKGQIFDPSHKFLAKFDLAEIEWFYGDTYAGPVHDPEGNIIVSPKTATFKMWSPEGIPLRQWTLPSLQTGHNYLHALAVDMIGTLCVACCDTGQIKTFDSYHDSDYYEVMEYGKVRSNLAPYQSLGKEGQFQGVCHMLIDRLGNFLIVSNSSRFGYRVQIYSPDCELITNIGVGHSWNYTPASNVSRQVAVDGEGKVYLSDGNRITVWG